MHAIFRRATIIAALLTPALACASNLPLKINFQGRLLDKTTNAPRNGSFTLTFRIYDVPTGGSPLLTEQQTGIGVNNGVFSVQIGSKTALPPDLFAGASTYVSLEVDSDGEMSPRQQLVMSPYSYSATQLLADSSARVRIGNAYSTFTATGDLLLAGGLSASSGVFVNGVLAASATFTTTGATQYSIVTASGVNVGGGTLNVAGGGGVSVSYGITAATATFGGIVSAQQFFGIGASTAAYKASDQSLTNSATLQNDNDLALPINANEVWVYEALVDAFSTNATPDIKFAFTVPAGATMKFGYQCPNASLTAFIQNLLTTSGTAGPLVSLAANVVNPCFFRGTVINGANAGYVQLQWAQNTSNGNATQVRAGSHLIGTRLK